MTTTFQADSSFDLVLTKQGLVSVITGAPAIAQNTVTACSTRRGECVLDTERGIPFDATVFSSLKQPQFEAAVRSQILQVQGVSGINSFEISAEGEKLQYFAEITTEFGESVQVTI